MSYVAFEWVANYSKWALGKRLQEVALKYKLVEEVEVCWPPFEVTSFIGPLFIDSV